MYQLECPDCHTINEIVSDTPIVKWECESCNSKPVTSLPTDENGELL